MSLLRVARRPPKHIARVLLRALATSPSGTGTGVIERDVCIVGGGPVGLALAGALGAANATRNGLSVSLVEAGDLSKIAGWTPTGDAFSNRVVTLTNVSRSFLQNFGAWEFMRHERVNGVDEIQAWDGLSDSRISFAGSNNNNMDYPPAPMSWVAEVLNIQHALLACLQKQGHVELLDNLRVQSISRDIDGMDGWPMVQLSDGRLIRARLLVGADGFNSPVRAFADIQSYGWDYDRRGVVATLQHVPKVESLFSKANSTAYQRFLPTGPIAFLPLTDSLSSMVWSVPPHIAAALQAAAPRTVGLLVNAAFRLPELSLRYMYDLLLDAHAKGTPLSPETVLEELRWRETMHSIDPHSSFSASQDPELLVGIPPEDAHMVPPLVTDIQAGTIASFPLRFQHADAYAGADRANRTCLIGDAAHTMNPLAGQGLNTGLADAAALARALETAVTVGGDVGSLTTLLPYTRERYVANHIMLSAVDKLHKLYANTSAPVVALRSTGLEVVNEFDSIKDLIMMSAGSHEPVTPSLSVWNAVAGAVETAGSAMSIATALGRGLGDRLATTFRSSRAT